jgi:hypothetical protein
VKYIVALEPTRRLSMVRADLECHHCYRLIRPCRCPPHRPARSAIALNCLSGLREKSRRQLSPRVSAAGSNNEALSSPRPPRRVSIFSAGGKTLHHRANFK